MAIEKHFIKQGIKESQIQEFLRKEFDRAGYSHINIQRTPLGTRIVVYASRPGLVIGKSGSRIKEITEHVRSKFELENPMLDVKEITEPFLNAQVIATKIARSLESGSFYKKVAGWYLSQIMKAGAIGVEIKISGKLGGQRGRSRKFNDGYIKHSGFYADNILDKGKAAAKTKPGIVGIQVKIMKTMPEIMERSEKYEDKGTEKTEG